MIGKLKGRIDDVDEDSVILDVGGVGYHIFCTTCTLASLPGRGEASAFVIETHVREDHIHLFGFPDAAERDGFRLLLTVQGVGVKMALAILSVFSPAELAQSIAARDVKSLTRVSGVGPKVAERLTTELKNKVGKLAIGALAGAGIAAGPARGKTGAILPPASVTDDAISALVNLGYARAEAYGAVMAAYGKLGESAKVDGLITDSLRSLARA